MKYGIVTVGLIIFTVLDVLFMIYLMVLKFTVGIDQAQTRFFVNHLPLCLSGLVVNILLAILLRLKD